MKKKIIELCEKLNLAHDFHETEHSGCWGKSCEGQHWVEELSIWHPQHPRWKRSFTEPGEWCLRNIEEFAKEEPLVKGK